MHLTEVVRSCSTECQGRECAIQIHTRRKICNASAYQAAGTPAMGACVTMHASQQRTSLQSTSKMFLNDKRNLWVTSWRAALMAKVCLKQDHCKGTPFMTRESCAYVPGPGGNMSTTPLLLRCFSFLTLASHFGTLTHTARPTEKKTRPGVIYALCRLQEMAARESGNAATVAALGSRAQQGLTDLEACVGEAMAGQQAGNAHLAGLLHQLNRGKEAAMSELQVRGGWVGGMLQGPAGRTRDWPV